MKQTEERQLPHTIPEALSRYENSEKIALICGEETLSYRELIADAKQTAHALLARGMSKGDRVVLEMSRSADYVRMYLGVIFAGGVSVTLHSGWPEQQRALAIQDCSPVLIVDDERARALRCAPLIGDVPGLPALSGPDPFQIIFTSGSTGEPKGVVLCHQLALTSLIDGAEARHLTFVRRLSRIPRRCILSDADLAFSAAAMVIFLALFWEKTLVLASDADRKTPESLEDCIRRRDIYLISVVPSRLRQCMTAPGFRKALSGLSLILLVGERADAGIQADIAMATDAELLFGYGSTEALHVLDTPLREGAEPLYDTGDAPVFLLEPEGLTQVPHGVIGEICIGGPAGQFGYYWNNPELTAKKYVDHPIYGRLLRTGDSARREPDGRLKILGRLDGMAKLHGMRIETSAIETALEAFPGVLRAAVKVHGEGTSAVLCGYYSGSVDQGALRRSLAETLPYYMVPALLRELPELPLNLNGKLDRRALPPIETRAEAYAAPETEQETLLCEVFAQVLHRDAPVGIDDSFFELGGDSVRGLAAGALLGELGYELKVEWLFAVPTVRALAPMLLPMKTEESDGQGWSLELSEEERSRIDRAVGWNRVETVYPVLFHAREYLSRNSFWMIPSIHMMRRNLSPEKLRSRLAELQRCRTALRSVFVGAGTSRPLQVVLKQAPLSFFETDLRALSSGREGVLSSRQEAYLRTLVTLMHQTDWSAAGQVPFRLGLIRVAEQTSVVFCFSSHLLLDAVGLSRVMEDLFSDSPILPDRHLFHRYMEKLVTADREPALRHWRTVTGGAEQFLRLPRGDGSAAFVHDEVVSSPELLERAIAFCKVRGVTLSALIHLIAGEVLMELLDLPRVCFASTSFGRDAAAARLTGMFIHHFPVCIRRGETLNAVQEQLLKGIRFGQLETEDLPEGLALPGMNGVLKLNVENAAEFSSEDVLPQLMRGNPAFAAAESAASAPPSGIDGELTLMVFLHGQFRLDFYYSPASVHRPFVKRFASAMMKRLRRYLEEEQASNA